MTTEHKPHSEPGEAGADTPSDSFLRAQRRLPRVSSPALVAHDVREMLNRVPCPDESVYQLYLRAVEGLDGLVEQVETLRIQDDAWAGQTRVLLARIEELKEQLEAEVERSESYARVIAGLDEQYAAQGTRLDAVRLERDTLEGQRDGLKEQLEACQAIVEAARRFIDIDAGYLQPSPYIEALAELVNMHDGPRDDDY